jgi:phosphohistidine phosphatase
VKRLAILRHAKTEPPASGMADFDRALEQRGWGDAQAIGTAMAARGWRFDLVLASPAQRVRETLDGIQQALSFDGEVRFEPRLYEAGAGQVKELLRQLPDALESVLVAGHNPTMQQVVLDLTDHHAQGLRDVVRMRYPTGALSVIELSAATWEALAPGPLVDRILPSEVAG